MGRVSRAFDSILTHALATLTPAHWIPHQRLPQRGSVPKGQGCSSLPRGPIRRVSWTLVLDQPPPSSSRRSAAVKRGLAFLQLRIGLQVSQTKTPKPPSSGVLCSCLGLPSSLTSFYFWELWTGVNALPGVCWALELLFSWAQPVPPISGSSGLPQLSLRTHLVVERQAPALSMASVSSSWP